MSQIQKQWCHSSKRNELYISSLNLPTPTTTITCRCEDGGFQAIYQTWITQRTDSNCPASQVTQASIVLDFTGNPFDYNPVMLLPNPNPNLALFY